MVALVQYIPQLFSTPDITVTVSIAASDLGAHWRRDAAPGLGLNRMMRINSLCIPASADG